jgi:hypothetical protein
VANLLSIGAKTKLPACGPIPVVKTFRRGFWDATKKSLDVGQKGVNPTPLYGIKAMYSKA